MDISGQNFPAFFDHWFRFIESLLFLKDRLSSLFVIALECGYLTRSPGQTNDNSLNVTGIRIPSTPQFLHMQFIAQMRFIVPALTHSLTRPSTNGINWSPDLLGAVSHYFTLEDAY